MRLIIFFLFLNFPVSLHARCALQSENHLINEARYILEGVILKTNFGVEDLTACNFKKKSLSYALKITDSFNLKFPLGEYQLMYEYQCGQKPSDILFSQGKTYLFAVKKIENRNLILVGTKCGMWGWDISNKDAINEKIKKIKIN